MSSAPPIPHETTLFVRSQCLCLHTQRAARALARRFDEALRPAGLKSGQFSLLISLNRPDPPSIGSVAALLAMDRTTLTANLKPLERRGLLAVVTNAADRRTRHLHLTQAGRTVLETAVPIWERTHAAVESELEPHAASQLRNSLQMLA